MRVARTLTTPAAPSYKNIEMTMWDVGGQDKIRRLWRHYFENTDALIFVVDANDRERVDEACEELHALVKNPQLSSASILVFANKMDLPHSMSASEVAEKLHLSGLPNRNWYIQSSSATTGQGLHEGLDWLAEKLKQVPRAGAVRP